MVALPAATLVTVPLVLSLLNSAVATPVALDAIPFVPLHVPQSISNVAVVDAHVPLPLVGLNVITHVPRSTVNAYVALQLLYVLVAALVTVIVDVPCFKGVIVNVPLLMDALATVDVPLVALNDPPLVVLTVVVLAVGYGVFPLVAPNDTVHAAFAVVNVYVLLHELY